MTIVSLLPLSLALLGYAAIAKLAARLFRRTQISWRATLLLVVTVAIASVVAPLVLSGIGLPAGVALPFGILAHVAIAAWFFHRFARSSAGEPLNPIAAVKLAGLLVLLGFVVFGAISLLATVLLRLAK